MRLPKNAEPPRNEHLCEMIATPPAISQEVTKKNQTVESDLKGTQQNFFTIQTAEVSRLPPH